MRAAQIRPDVRLQKSKKVSIFAVKINLVMYRDITFISDHFKWT